MAASNLVALAIILTTAATLNANEDHRYQYIGRCRRGASAGGRPNASIIFALGIVGTGLLAVPVLAGSAAYAIGEALKLAGRARLQAEARQGVLRHHRRRDGDRRADELLPDQSDQGAVLGGGDQRHRRGPGDGRDDDRLDQKRRSWAGSRSTARSACSAGWPLRRWPLRSVRWAGACSPARALALKRRRGAC